MKETISYCGMLDDGALFNFYPHPDLVKMCGHEDVYKVKVVEVEAVPDVHAVLSDRHTGELKEIGRSYYAWWDEEEQQFLFTAPNLHCVEICFPYGSKAEMEKGRGQVYRVSVEVIEES